MHIPSGQLIHHHRLCFAKPSQLLRQLICNIPFVGKIIDSNRTSNFSTTDKQETHHHSKHFLLRGERFIVTREF
ncbi:hypothetical protein ACHAWT_000356 [Skeletonema menzelii]